MTPDYQHSISQTSHDSQKPLLSGERGGGVGAQQPHNGSLSECPETPDDVTYIDTSRSDARIYFSKHESDHVAGDDAALVADADEVCPADVGPTTVIRPLRVDDFRPPDDASHAASSEATANHSAAVSGFEEFVIDRAAGAGAAVPPPVPPRRVTPSRQRATPPPQHGDARQTGPTESIDTSLAYSLNGSLDVLSDAVAAGNAGRTRVAEENYCRFGYSSSPASQHSGLAVSPASHHSGLAVSPEKSKALFKQSPLADNRSGSESRLNTTSKASPAPATSSGTVSTQDLVSKLKLTQLPSGYFSQETLDEKRPLAAPTEALRTTADSTLGFGNINNNNNPKPAAAVPPLPAPTGKLDLKRTMDEPVEQYFKLGYSCDDKPCTPSKQVVVLPEKPVFGGGGGKCVDDNHCGSAAGDDVFLKKAEITQADSDGVLKPTSTVSTAPDALVQPGDALVQSAGDTPYMVHIADQLVPQNSPQHLKYMAAAAETAAAEKRVDDDQLSSATTDYCATDMSFDMMSAPSDVIDESRRNDVGNNSRPPYCRTQKKDARDRVYAADDDDDSKNLIVHTLDLQPIGVESEDDDDERVPYLGDSVDPMFVQLALPIMQNDVIQNGVATSDDGVSHGGDDYQPTNAWYDAGVEMTPNGTLEANDVLLSSRDRRDYDSDYCAAEMKIIDADRETIV